MDRYDIEDRVYDWLPTVAVVAIIVASLAVMFVVGVAVYAWSTGAFR